VACWFSRAIRPRTALARRDRRSSSKIWSSRSGEVVLELCRGLPEESAGRGGADEEVAKEQIVYMPHKQLQQCLPSDIALTVGERSDETTRLFIITFGQAAEFVLQRRAHVVDASHEIAVHDRLESAGRVVWRERRLSRIPPAERTRSLEASNHQTSDNSRTGYHIVRQFNKPSRLIAVRSPVP
jgi:hypothetical protein